MNTYDIAITNEASGKLRAFLTVRSRNERDAKWWALSWVGSELPNEHADCKVTEISLTPETQRVLGATMVP